MSIQLLTTCEPDAIRGAATTVDRYVNDLSDEFTPLNLRALALTESDWEGEAAAEFRTTWIEFRTACGILVEVMRDTAEIMTKLAQRLALAQRQFQAAVDEARAAGLQVDMTTGEVTPPPVVLSPEPVLPLGSREAETAEAVRRANLQIQDAIREVTAADQEAEQALAALQPQVNELALILKALGVVMEGYGGFAGTIGAVSNGLSGAAGSAAAQQWQRLADHPFFGPANVPAVRNVAGVGSIPRLGVLGVPIAYASNIASGDNPARSATRAIASSAAGFVSGAVGAAGTSMLAAGVGAVVMATPPGALVVGLGFVAGVGLSMLGSYHGDKVGAELHDHVISPLMDRIEGTWKDWMG